MEEWEDIDTGLIWQIEKSDNHDLSSAMEFEEENEGWRIPSIAEWETLIKKDRTWKDSVPFKDKGRYWSCNLYPVNPEQKSLCVEYTFDKLDIFFMSNIGNYLSVRLVKG